MSAASPHIGQPARARAESFGARWERLLAVASVCLPIPLLAATGLSIPLPSSVERIGAALVAWVDDAESAPLPAFGDIILAGTRQAVPERGAQVAPAARAALAQAVAPETTSAGGSATKDGGKGSTGGSTGSTGSGGSGPPATGGETTPPPPPGPIEGTVDDVTKATQPVVDVVEDTVGVVDETVGGVEDLADDLLGGGGLLGSGK